MTSTHPNSEYELGKTFKEAMLPLIPLAQKAYGSRATDSLAHETSRQFTELLAEYSKRGGALLPLSKELNVSYAALQRRLKTADVAPLPRSARSKADSTEYPPAAERLKKVKKISTVAYHTAIKQEYDRGLSLNKLASYMGLKSAYPLYYGLNNARKRSQ